MQESNLRITYKGARVNAELSRKQASDALGIAINTLRNYEDGITQPSWERHLEMSKLYKIPKEILCPPKSE